MQEIAMATDNQLRTLAQMKANYDYANSPNRKFEHKASLSVPIMDSFLIGATTKGGLKNKVLAGGSQLKDWGIFLAVTGLYNKAVNKMVSKSETLQNFKENSPFAFGVANTALGVTAGISGIHYVNKGYQKFIAPLIPKKIKNIAKDFVDSTDTSAIGKSINAGMKKFSKNYPKLTKALNKAAIWAMPVFCTAVLLSMAVDIFKTKANEKRTYEALKDARLYAAQQLAMRNSQGI